MKPAGLRPMVCAAAMLFSAAVAAQKIPALEEVNPALSDPPRAALDVKRAALASTRTSLRARIQSYEERCMIVFEKEVHLVKICPGEKIQLEADKEAYIVAVKSFNWELEQAVGEYRIGLERRIRDMDEALMRDAEAVKRFGFSRRAEDFERWAQISREAQHKAIDKLLERIFDIGADELRSGIMEQLSKANSADIDGMLLKLQAAGLGAAAAQESLRRYRETGNVELLRPIALQLTKELRSAVKFDEALEKDSKVAAAWQVLQHFAPPVMRELVAVGETAGWATYGAGMQVVAVAEVSRLNKLTVKELKGLQTIHCVSERHTVQRYDAKQKLAALTGRGLSELVKPTQSKSCAG